MDFIHGKSKVGTAERRMTQMLNVPGIEVIIRNQETGRDIPDHARISSLRKKKSKH